MEEDFEAALMYKKKITELQKSMLNPDLLKQQYMSKQPVFSMRQMFEKLTSLNTNYTKSLLDSINPWSDESDTTQNLPKIRARLLNSVLVMTKLK